MAKSEKTKGNENENKEISKSKAKREQRRKEIAKSKRRKFVYKSVGVLIVAAILIMIAASVGKNIYVAAIRTTSSPDYSAELTADGRINGVVAKDQLTLVDYANLSIPADQVAATADEVDSDIQSMLMANKELISDVSYEIADGDEVNIDYVGTIDGVEFEGGSSDGLGYDLTIGSGTFIDDFEQQLIGHSPGEEVNVEVTFPEEYGNDELNGKDAVFAVTINGVNVTPELTDEFVVNNLSEEGVSTADEYRAAVENYYHELHLQDYLADYIIEASTVNSYPSAYLKAVKAYTKYDDESMLQMFALYGLSGYENLWDMMGDEVTDELSYEKDLTERAKEVVKEALVYQAIFEDAGLTLDMDAALSEMADTSGEDYVESMLATYGEGHMAQDEIRNIVLDYLTNLYK